MREVLKRKVCRTKEFKMKDGYTIPVQPTIKIVP